MFGGGMKRGFLYGETAPERPLRRHARTRCRIRDLHATIFTAMGISPQTAFDVEKRPFYATEDGKGRRCRRCSREYEPRGTQGARGKYREAGSQGNGRTRVHFERNTLSSSLVFPRAPCISPVVHSHFFYLPIPILDGGVSLTVGC